MLKTIHNKNPILFWLGTLHLAVFVVLLFYYPFNKVIVLGINSVLKPMKFALSIWIYSWTMAILLQFVNEVKKIKIYSWAAVIVMCFEQFAITYQAIRGELSHFNTSNSFGIILFSVMGIFILTITLWTAYILYVFIKQKEYSIAPELVLSIKLGLFYFVIFSLFGGYISSTKGHTVDAIDGSKGLFFLNWSASFGDLRVAHFFGIHSLQIIPLFGYLLSKYFKSNFHIKSILIFSIFYFLYVIITMFQAFLGVPFI